MDIRALKSYRVAALCAGAAALALSLCVPAAAQVTEKNVAPSTSLVPANGGPSAAPSAASSPAPAPAEGAAAAKPKTAPHHAAMHFEVEPANARLKVLKDTPIYSEPAKSSKAIEKGQEGKYVNVTGSTHYFLQVKLKSGKTGYIDPDAVDLLKASDKVFMLSHNAAVLDKPNRWGKKLSEVHKGHNVHIVGIALNYVRIRMKSGLEGYIPMSAME